MNSHTQLYMYVHSTYVCLVRGAKVFCMAHKYLFVNISHYTPKYLLIHKVSVYLEEDEAQIKINLCAF